MLTRPKQSSIADAPSRVASKRIVRHLQATKDNCWPHQAVGTETTIQRTSAETWAGRSAPDDLTVGEIALQEQLLAKVGRLLDGRVGMWHVEDVGEDENLYLDAMRCGRAKW